MRNQLILFQVDVTYAVRCGRIQRTSDQPIIRKCVDRAVKVCKFTAAFEITNRNKLIDLQFIFSELLEATYKKKKKKIRSKRPGPTGFLFQTTRS